MYQSQLQTSFFTKIKLLLETPDPNNARDPRLVALAKEVNDFFEPKAKALLEEKRAELRAAGHERSADRSEVTVLISKHGLQLSFSEALNRKEVAPAPRKSLTRRVLGPLYPGRKFWVMPEHDTGEPPVITTVRWPWAFWGAVLAAVIAVVAWSVSSNSMLG